MIHLLVRRRRPHSGMRTFAEGLAEVGGAAVAVTELAHAGGLALAPGDCVVFDDRIGADGLAVIEQGARHAGGRIDYALLLHSPLLQMDLSHELEATLTLLRDRGDGRPLDLVLCADRELAALLRVLARPLPCAWLPHCVPARVLGDRAAPPRQARPEGHAVCWLPLTIADHHAHYRHKNTYCQLAAVRMARAASGLPIEVATNFASDLWRRFAALLDVPVTEIGSIDGAALAGFRQRVALGLCASLSESFSYNALELMVAGVPTLFTATLAWACRSVELVRLCRVDDPGSIGEIAERIGRLLVDEAAYREASRLGRDVALATVDVQHRLAREVLAALADPALRPGLQRRVP